MNNCTKKKRTSRNRKNLIRKGVSFILIFLMVFMASLGDGATVKAASKILTSSDVANYFNGQVGKAFQNSMCLKFVADSFSNLGAVRDSTCCAYQYGNKHIISSNINNIPVGADVFFGNCGDGPCKICRSAVHGHIGVYIGNGYFVHATGGKVQKTSITASYWKSRFRGWGYHGNVSIYQSPGGDQPIPPSGSDDGLPMGVVDQITGGQGFLTIRGWAFDKSAKFAQLAIDIYFEGEKQGYRIFTGKSTRKDVASAWGCGENQGFEETINLSVTGTKRVTVYAIDSENPSKNTVIYQGTVTINPAQQNNTNLIGSLDFVIGGNGLRVAGWAKHPDFPNLFVRIDVYVGGPAGKGEWHTLGKANINRTDVGGHGFDQIVPTSKTGIQDIYVYALDPTDNTKFILLGKQTVTITPKPSVPSSYKLHVWVSDTGMGETPQDFLYGRRYYLCYDLIDNSTGKRIDQDYPNLKYTVKEKMVGPDGKTKNEFTYNNDNNWIACIHNQAGKYSGNVTVTGDISISQSVEYTITKGKATLSASTSNVSLDLNGSKSVNITVGGNYSGQYYLNFKNDREDIIGCEWGVWKDGSNTLPLNIKAKKAGTATITVVRCDDETDEELASCKIVVSVKGQKYKITYNANGGTGAPAAQVKEQGQAINLSNVRPDKHYEVSFQTNGGSVLNNLRKVSCEFLGWSAGSRTYSSGDIYSEDGNVILYAKWRDPVIGFLPDAIRNGYKFKGWYTKPSGGNKIDAATVITKDEKIYAQWTKQEQDISSVKVQMETNLEYTGKEVRPKFVLQDGAYILKDGIDFAIVYQDNINAGTARAVVKGLGQYTGTISKPFQIEKAPQKCNVTAERTNIKIGEITRLEVSGNQGSLSYESSDPQVAVVDDNGKVTGISSGDATIFVKVSPTDNYKKAEFQQTIKVSKKEISAFRAELVQKNYTYDGMAKQPKVRVIDDGGKILQEGIDYSLTYSNNVEAGVGSVLITGIGNYQGAIKKLFSIYKAQPELNFEISSNEIYVGEEAQILIDDSFHIASCRSDNTEIATADVYGNVKGVGAGLSIITITTEESDNYLSASQKIRIKVKQKEEPGENDISEKPGTGQEPEEPEKTDPGQKPEEPEEPGENEEKRECPSTDGFHHMESVVDKEPSCAVEGLQHRECTVCHYTEGETSVIPATGHVWGESHKVQKPTVIREGLNIRFCDVCDAKEFSAIPKLEPTGVLNVTGTLPLKKRQTVKLKATGLSKGDSVISWTSSDPSIAKIDKGRVTGKRIGMAQIVATLRSGKELTVSVSVQATSVKAQEFSNLPYSLIIKKGKSKILKPVLKPITSQDRICYKSSNKKIVTIDEKGRIKAKKRGSTVIIVKAGKALAYLKVTVK